MTQDVVVGTAGHIDHGKTALVRALTGVDTDRLPEEKRRGVTIEPGFAELVLGDWRIALVDVPGHERFIRNMLAGATGLDLAMLIVAADDSVMPQTREHLEILRFLEIQGGVIVLTKCDLAEPAWLALVEDDVRALVQGTFLEGSAIVRTSSVTGEGIDQLKQALAAACESTARRPDTGVFRLAIDRSFSVAGHGTVVTGTVSSGRVTVGDELEWLPSRKLVRVRGLERHGHLVESIGRGSRAAINLGGVHHTEIVRGHELATPGALAVERVLTVELTRSVDAARAFRHRGRYKLHLGTTEVSAVLNLFEPDDEPVGRLAQLLLDEPLAAFWGQPFVLRSESPPSTLGGGRILGVQARRCRRRDRATRERLEHLRSAAPLERLVAVLALRGLDSSSELALAAASGINRDEIADALAQLEATGAFVALRSGSKRAVRLPRALVEELEDRVRRALERLHDSNPRRGGWPRASVAAMLPDVPAEITADVIERLIEKGVIIASERQVALAGKQPVLTQAERQLMSEMLVKIKAGGATPPDTAELASAAKGLSTAVADLLALLRDSGQIVEISPQIYLASEVESQIRAQVIERLRGGAACTMAELRDLLGATRKYAVPLGEYLDRIGLTRRDGDLRRLTADPTP